MRFVTSCVVVAAIAIAAAVSAGAASTDWIDMMYKSPPYSEMREDVPENMTKVCEEMDRAMSVETDLKVDRNKAFEFAKNWLKSGYLTSSKRHSRTKIINSWERIIYEPASCTESSWKDLVYLAGCKSPSNLEILNEPMKAYATRCLTSDYVGELIKSQAKKADFVDADFIKKFYEDNPNDKPLHIDWIGDKYWTKGIGWTLSADGPNPDLNCCRARRSFGAVNDAIKRDLAKQGKDASNEFHNKPDALLEYLDEKLFNPCEKAGRYCRNLAGEMVKVTEYYEGGQQALIATLDKTTKEILFQAKYCEMLWLDKSQVLREAKKMFVQSESQSSRVIV